MSAARGKDENAGNPLPNKRQYILEGLDCAGCSAKIEDRVAEMDGVSNAYINFTTKTLNIEVEADANNDGIYNEISKIVNGFEPHVKVVENTEYMRKSRVEPRRIDKSEIIKIASSLVTLIVAMSGFMPEYGGFALFLAAYLIVGYDVIRKSISGISKGRVFDENFLMTIATVGAFLIGAHAEAVAVMLFYKVGELMQSIAVNKSRMSIASLMDVRPEVAYVARKGGVVKMSPEDVQVGDIIEVKPGEKIPLDGIVAEGSTSVDTSALTGESMPRDIYVSDSVLSGFINKTGRIRVNVTKPFAESEVVKLIELVENAASHKAPTESFITKFAKYYTPAVVFISASIAIIPPLLMPGEVFSDWLYKGLVILVISCPCALVVSIPLSFFGGIGAASRNGVLVKGGNYLEALNDVTTVVFDKTGTLTKGNFEVTNISVRKNVERGELLRLAAHAEYYSNHPIAKAIVKAYHGDTEASGIESHSEMSGNGVRALVGGKVVLLGSRRFMASEGVETGIGDSESGLGTIVHVSSDGEYLGSIEIADEIKEDAEAMISSLKGLGVGKTVMLTGDLKNVAESIGAAIGIDEIYSELLPHEKVERLEEIEKNQSGKGKVIFLGDGINDAPVIARADIGIAMGGLGSDAAIEAADIVIMTDEPSKIVDAIRIAKFTRKVVIQNIVFALLVKLVVMGFGAFGIATMWEAVFADVGVTITAIINTMRILRKY